MNQIEPTFPITLEITISDVDLILTAVGKLPYENSVKLIDLIRGQAVAQMQKKDETVQ